MEAVESEMVDFKMIFNRRKDICDFLPLDMCAS